MVGLDQIGAAVAGVSGGAKTQGQPATPFGGVFQSLVAQTTSLDQQAQKAVTGLLNGSGVEVHEAMIATQKSDMAFELALQVRNKAVGAYQQMMSMQF
jgi:flagellar hook-basal body complex protein FliE